MTGKPTLISNGDPEFPEAWRICQWEKITKELGSTEFPKAVLIIKIEAKTIKLMENTLKLRGYASSQVWEAREK
jgi:hypothetical protein